MTQDEINQMLAAALDDAQARLERQERCIELLVDQIETLNYRINGGLKEVETARLHYAEQRQRLGMTIDLSSGSLLGRDFGQPGQ